MTVRKAVAKRETETAAAKAGPTLAQVAEQTIANHAAMLDAVLPPSTDRRRFAQMAIQACRQAPDLAGCFATKQGAASFLLAIGQAAMVNLEPNTPTQDCWILPRKRGSGKDAVQEANLTIGYRGIMKLARRSGTLRSIVAEVVRERDTFDYGYGADGPYLTWKPAEGDRGELTHAFAIAWTKDGGRAQMVLNRTDVEARRAVSDSWKADQRNNTSYSPWNRDESREAMWRKSAVRALAPYLDLTVEAATVIERDERPVYFDADAHAAVVEDPFAELGPGDDGQGGDDAPGNVDSDGVIDAETKDKDAKDAEPTYPPGHEPF